MAKIAYGQFPAVIGEVTPENFNELTRILSQIMLQLDTDSFRLGDKRTPSSASDTGTYGTVVYDDDYIYVCTDTDTWKRAAITTW